MEFTFDLFLFNISIEMPRFYITHYCSIDPFAVIFRKLHALHYGPSTGSTNKTRRITEIIKSK